LYVPRKEWLELPAMAIKCMFWKSKFIDSDIDLLMTKFNQICDKAIIARIKVRTLIVFHLITFNYNYKIRKYVS